ncbi:MAG: hypothetical protein A2898_03575 [Candidatus Kerfeldbacteria bacterium RIFCSPLOWO2_01_FULL_48_11]|uniref:Uncharacterized protein n=1 Tax=Candidatus Kerfeldbacteria bacterium RIFCSPLOWO2_01_FULL_48_11 TaxID=1798543 RepID=A0A1G2B3X3_9BACT|nr:MAG: hypothetical protein A2898_03575 [Candidatus Kerfeldbacteria bacterium RIFCSPLOWO2_01_FULL_48_11]
MESGTPTPEIPTTTNRDVQSPENTARLITRAKEMLQSQERWQFKPGDEVYVIDTLGTDHPISGRVESVYRGTSVKLTLPETSKDFHEGSRTRELNTSELVSFDEWSDIMERAKRELGRG